MNYQAHLSTIFATPELADEFMKLVIKSLNGATLNGQWKVTEVHDYGVVTIKIPEQKTLCGTMPKQSYVFSMNKASTVTLDKPKANDISWDDDD